MTLPVAALREAQVKAGDELRVSVDEHGRLVLTPETGAHAGKWTRWRR